MLTPSPSDESSLGKPPRRGSWLIPLVALIAVATLGWAAWDTRHTVNEMRAELAARLVEADTYNRETQAIAKQARQDTKEALAKLSVLENKLGESQNQQVALEAMYQELSRHRDEVSLAAIEEVLELASQQLQLAGNVRAALIALQSVDTRLARADNKSRWTQLRRALNQDMEKLKALPFVDTVAISAKLDSVIASVDNLPLISDPVIAEANPPITPAGGEPRSWKNIGRELMRDLGELIRIRNLGKADVPLLAPSQAYFLRENLKLRLLNARLALLARNDASYKADLKNAAQWLALYFDPKISAVTTARATVRQLAENSISISPPDITDSLNAVRNARLGREKANR